MGILESADEGTAHVFSDNLRAWKAWRAKPIRVATARLGEDALVRGRVETAGFVTPALVTERECVAGIVTVWHGTEPLLRMRAIQSFFVVDPTGERLLVSDVDMLLRTSYEDVTGLAQRLAHFGTRFYTFAQPHFSGFSGTPYTLTEQLLLPGMAIEVFGRIGHATWIDRGAYRENLTEIATMSG